MLPQFTTIANEFNIFFFNQIKLPDTFQCSKQLSDSEAELYTFMLKDKTILRSKDLLLFMVDRLTSYDRNSEGIEFSILLRTLSALTCKYTHFYILRR